MYSTMASTTNLNNLEPRIHIKPISNLSKFDNFDKRLKSFEGWPNSDIDVRKLAQAGFHYVNYKDVVKCHYCEITLLLWRVEDDPFTEHMKFSQHCPMASAHDKQIRKMSDQSTLEDDESDYDNIYNRANVFLKFLTFESRINSYFHLPNWEKFRIMCLAERGIYFCNTLKKLKCFWCFENVGYWLDGQNDLMRHIVNGKPCHFMERVLNRNYIQYKYLYNVYRICRRNPYLSNIDLMNFIKQSIDLNIAEKELSCFVCSNLSSLTRDFKNIDAIFNKYYDTLIDKNNNEIIKKSTDQSDKPNEILLCKICMNKEICGIFKPCKHALSCAVCVQKLKICPICRKKITKFSKIYLS